jgi:integrase
MARAKTRMRAGTYVLDMWVKGPNGTRQRIQRSGFKTVKEMEAERAKLTLESTAGVNVKASTSLTVADLFDRFLSEKDQLYAGKREADPLAGANTLASYRQAYAYALPVIGGLKLSQLERSQPFDDLRASLLTKGLKVSTVRAYLQKVRFAVAWGVKKRMLARDVAKESDLPAPAVREHFVLPTHAEMAAAIREAAACPFRRAGNNRTAGEIDGVLFAAAAHLLAVTGLRISELLNLRWEHIDAEALTLRVAFGKTPAARRTISVTADDIAALAGLRDRTLVGGGLVFVFADGISPNRDAMNNRLEEVGKVVGIHLYPHLFRHYHASACIEAGMGFKSLQERLGHESITTTMDTYGHLRPDHDRDAAVRAGEFLRLARV